MADEPFSSAKEIAAQDDKERRQLALDYRAVFGGERGRKVLADLERKFGFRKPSAAPGMNHGDVMLREGMKMPFYEIERMYSLPAPKRTRQRKALSEAPAPPAGAE